MTSREELLKSKEYWMVQFQVSLFQEVENYLSENKISKTEFAKQLGVSKGYISQILNGNFDHKISKLIELSLAIGKAPKLLLENFDLLSTPEAEKSQLFQDSNLSNEDSNQVKTKFANRQRSSQKTKPKKSDKTKSKSI
jgi:transcriptional regulator with XRE-family HTH domain